MTGTADVSVSIGVPVFNGEKYLEMALESIVTQTCDDFEVIITDNDSSDRTRAIAEAFRSRDPRVQYHRNSRNVGAARNFNRTFELARGRYFKWMACDDLIAPTFLERCVAVLDARPEVVLCFPDSAIIDAEGRLLGVHQYRGDTSSSRPEVRFRNLVVKPDTGYQIFGLSRSEVLRNTGLHGAFPASDLVLLAELALHGAFHRIPEPLLLPRSHPEQATRLIPVERDRAVFYDTSAKGEIRFPKWQYLGGYVRAVRRAPLGGRERLCCYGHLLRWMSMPDHFRALGKDIVLAGRAALARSI